MGPCKPLDFDLIQLSMKFDKAGDYIKQWCPELSDLGPDEIHLPQKDAIFIGKYMKYTLAGHFSKKNKKAPRRRHSTTTTYAASDKVN